jgi:hypothetical protein
MLYLPSDMRYSPSMYGSQYRQSIIVHNSKAHRSRSITDMYYNLISNILLKFKKPAAFVNNNERAITSQILPK